MTVATKNVDQAFALAKERYAALGVDVDKALDRLARIPLSLHCWQGDDVGGFEATGEAIELDLRGTPLVYDVKKQELVCKQVKAPVPLVDGELRLQVFLDRGSIEAFGGDGRTAVSVAAIPDDSNRSIGIAARGGPAVLRILEVHPLRSARVEP